MRDNLCARWRAIDQPATREQVATEAVRLTVMPVASNIDTELLTETLCEHIEELRPTVFALVRGAAAHRRNAEFLSISKLLREIERAGWRAARYRDVFEGDLSALLADKEEGLAYQRKCDAERKRRRDEEQRKLVKRLQEEWAAEMPELLGLVKEGKVGGG
jgi:non-homologous end joining protein Ku